MTFLFRLAKIIDIGYITVIHLFFAIIASRILELGFVHLPTNLTNYSFGHHFLMMAFVVWVVGIVIYFFRNVNEHIPSPFHKLWGLNHYLIKENNGIVVFIFTLMTLQPTLKRLIEEVYSRLK